jgi:hypothetical protein
MGPAMRLLSAAAVVAAALSAAGALADDEAIAASTLAAIAALATKGYVHPTAATIRNVRKSKARNGLGYCGEVSLDGGSGGFTLFHVILAGNESTASILRLSDYPDGDQSRNAVMVRQLFVNFGCIEPAPPPPQEPDIR